jgi:hypothetical protein
MELWNDGMLGFSIIPVFHLSNIPMMIQQND